MAIPMIINTIENLYKDICIFGDNNDAKEIFNYLKKNKEINVYNTEELASNKVEVIIYFEKTFKMPDTITDIIYTVNYYELLNYNRQNFYEDIYMNIIPKLKSNGIYVLAVQSPDLRKYRPRIPLMISITWFIIVRKLFHNYAQVWINHLSSRKVVAEYLSTRAEQSKGYLKVYGNGKYINYDDGFRRIPFEFKSKPLTRKLFIYGFCMAANPMLMDTETIGAKLQNMLKSNYRVFSRGNSETGMNLIMRKERYKKGDVVVFFTSHKDNRPKELGIETIELTEIFNHEKRIWKHITDNGFHCDGTITYLVAREITARIMKEKIHCCSNFDSGEVVFGSSRKKPPVIEMYKDIQFENYLQKIHKLSRGGTTAA